ncbi:MAG: NADH-quinone oxidoreductase subunit A [Candidatus Gastranaerophilaceae bacterium]
MIFAGIILLFGKIFAPKTENSFKNSTFACGMYTLTNNKIFINQRYFIIVLLCLIYGAEVLLLFPFALALNVLKLYVFFQAFIFISIMLLSLVYAIQKNMLRFR